MRHRTCSLLLPRTEFTCRSRRTCATRSLQASSRSEASRSSSRATTRCATCSHSWSAPATLLSAPSCGLTSPGCWACRSPRRPRQSRLRQPRRPRGARRQPARSRARSDRPACRPLLRGHRRLPRPRASSMARRQPDGPGRVPGGSRRQPPRQARARAAYRPPRRGHRRLLRPRASSMAQGGNQTGQGECQPGRGGSQRGRQGPEVTGLRADLRGGAGSGRQGQGGQAWQGGSQQGQKVMMGRNAKVLGPRLGVRGAAGQQGRRAGQGCCQTQEDLGARLHLLDVVGPRGCVVAGAIAGASSRRRPDQQATQALRRPQPVACVRLHFGSNGGSID